MTIDNHIKTIGIDFFRNEMATGFLNLKKLKNPNLAAVIQWLEKMQPCDREKYLTEKFSQNPNSIYADEEKRAYRSADIGIRTTFQKQPQFLEEIKARSELKFFAGHEKGMLLAESEIGESAKVLSIITSGSRIYNVTCIHILRFREELPGKRISLTTLCRLGGEDAWKFSDDSSHEFHELVGNVLDVLKLSYSLTRKIVDSAIMQS